MIRTIQAHFYESSSGRKVSRTDGLAGSGQFSGRTGRLSGNTERFPVSTERSSVNTGRFAVSTGRLSANTGRFAASTGRFPVSTGRPPVRNNYIESGILTRLPDGRHQNIIINPFRNKRDET